MTRGAKIAAAIVILLVTTSIAGAAAWIYFQTDTNTRDIGQQNRTIKKQERVLRRLAKVQHQTDRNTRRIQRLLRLDRRSRPVRRDANKRVGRVDAGVGVTGAAPMADSEPVARSPNKPQGGGGNSGDSGGGGSPPSAPPPEPDTPTAVNVPLAPLSGVQVCVNDVVGVNCP